MTPTRKNNMRRLLGNSTDHFLTDSLHMLLVSSQGDAFVSTSHTFQVIISLSQRTDSRKPMAAKKIDLLSRFKQSKPSHSNGHIEQDSRRSKSGSLAHPDQKSNIPSRMTASNGIVGSKPSSKVRPAYEKSQTLQLVAPKQSHSMIESRALGGMSEEDDSLEKDLALSSPVKGSEYRAATKVVHICCIVSSELLLTSFTSVHGQAESRTIGDQVP